MPPKCAIAELPPRCLQLKAHMVENSVDVSLAGLRLARLDQQGGLLVKGARKLTTDSLPRGGLARFISGTTS